MNGRGNALLILVACVLVVAIVVVWPVARIFSDQSAQAEESTQLVSLYRSELASRDRLKAELELVRQREAAASGLLGGANASLAAAELQQIVKKTVERAGGQLRSAQNLPVRGENGFEKIEVQFDLSLPLAGLKSVLYRLEAGSPYLFLDNVDVRVWENAGAENIVTGTGNVVTENRGADTAREGPVMVQAQWTVRGYRWAGQR